MLDLKTAAARKILIVAHRGASGGNIPCNTLAAYEIALKQGADMIEIDVSMSADGKLFIFHPGMEHAHLNAPIDISRMTADEISRLRFVNFDDTPTQFGLNTLDEILDAFKDRCYINVDKFWEHPREISDAIRAHGMTEQILVKTAPENQLFDIIESYAPEIQYMPIVKQNAGDVHEALIRRHIRYVGQELIFRTENDPSVSEETLARLKRDGILTWVNAIVYNYKDVLSAGRNDDVSLTQSPDDGWGWLARRGFDLIQTDWPLMLKMYLESEGLLLR